MVYAEPEFSFKFGSTGTDDDEFNDPRDVILDKNANKIYVVDSNNDRISVFEDDGDFDFEYGTFCDIVAIQDCNDNADGADDDGDGQFNNPLAIARDALGKFFVVDSDNERIQIFEDDGKFQLKFGSSDSGLDEYLGTAKGIVIQESTNEILVSNIERDSISVFDSDGDFMFEFDSLDGNDSFKNPTFMVIDNSKQMLYVSDSGNDRIIVFELVTGTTCPSGTEVVDGVCFVEEFGSAGTDEGEFDTPAGLAYDSTDDLLYVADSNNNRIQIFKIVDGETCPSSTEEVVNGVCFVEEFGSAGTGDGKFDTPLGIAIDTTNDLLVIADSDNDRIQVFNLNSEPAVLVPNKPDNLKASPVSPTSIILSWNEPTMANNVPDITGYKIEYRVGSDDYIPVTQNTGSKTTSFIHQGLDSDETYSYRVYSVNSEGTSVTSSSASTKPQHTTTPTALTATAISPSQIKLSWLPPSETFGQTISGYKILREINEGIYDDNIGNTNAKTTSFIVTNLQTDKTYTYAVSANIGYGSTSESPTASATPREDSVNVEDDPITSTAIQMAKSSPPIKLTASVVSPTQINLAWSAPVENGNTPITGYKIEVKKDNKSYTTLVEDTKSITKTYTHTNLITNSKYTYRISAINIIGTSEPSNEFYVTPKSTNIQISPLGTLNIDEGKLLLFTVKLLDNSVNNVVFSLDKNPPIGANIISNTGVFSWTPTSSDGGKTYTMDIVAKKDGIEDRETITIIVKDVMSSSQPEPQPTEPKELGIASFVDETKDPQSYVDRYNNEATYKKWFDENFAEYDSIYQAVGLEAPLLIPASFVDETKDPQSYVDRYNNEATYKKWFDENFAEYDSIYQAVGLEAPVVKEKKFGICGPGTKLIDEVCTIVDKPSLKPWWQFW